MKKLALVRDPETNELLLADQTEEEVHFLGEVVFMVGKDLTTQQPNQYWTGRLFDIETKFPDCINLDEALANLLFRLDFQQSMVIVKQEELDAYLKIRKDRFSGTEGEADPVG